MLKALWHIRGGVLISGNLTEEKILRHFASAFAGHCKPVVRTTDVSVEFYDPWWRFFTSGEARDLSQKEYWRGLSPLGVFECGKVTIVDSPEGKTLYYDVQTLHSLIFTVLGSIAIGVFVWMGGLSTASAVLVSTAAFLWLYVTGMLWASFRARAFFHKVVADIR